MSVLRTRALGGLLVAAAALIVTAAPASASVSHTFSGSFGSATSSVVDPYPLSEPTEVAIDQASHDLYVADYGNHRVEKFDPTGHFMFMFGLKVNKTAEENGRPTELNICPAAGHPADVCQVATPAESPGAFEQPTWLAIDNFPFGEGDIYVGDVGDNVVTKYDSSGHVITSWGVSGQKTGSDDPSLPGFGALFSLAVGPGCASPSEPKTGRCKPNGTLYVGGRRYGENVREYTQNGEFIVDTFQQGSQLKLDSAGNLYYVVIPFGTFEIAPEVWMNIQKGGSEGESLTPLQVTTDWPTSGFNLDPTTRELYQVVETRGDEEDPHGLRIDHYSADCDPPKGPCEPVDTFGEGHLTAGKEISTGINYGGFSNSVLLKGVAVDGASHAVYTVNATPGAGEVVGFADSRPIVTTRPPSNVTATTVTLNGHIDPAGRGNINECRFEYGFDTSYGHTLPCTPDPSSGNFTGETDVSAEITGLSPGTHEHYRVVAGNTAGAQSNGADELFATATAPAIDGLLAEKLTATSAELEAKVNPNGLKTTYRFQYGPSVAYGQEVTGTIEPASSDQEITAQLSGLTPHVIYHYRLVVENGVAGKEEGGTTTSEDHTFNFYPPSCPNENVRQQVKANYLPECRAYELVSPANANGTQLYPGGPNTGLATSPSRLAFTGLWSTIPNSGGSPIDGSGDLYVSTRTSGGWVTRYVGPPSSEVAVAGGPPRGLFGQGGTAFGGFRTAVSNGGGFTADIINNNDFTDPGMDRFVDWNDGSQEFGGGNPTPIASNAPYVWSAEGGFLDRWPTNLATVPQGINPLREGSVSPAGAKSLDCVRLSGSDNCPGEVAGSADLSHFAFSTEWNIFAVDGQLSAPGSVYDNNTQTSSVVVASKLPNGDPIPSEPNDHYGDPLQIPGLSKDGSHILMGSPGTGPCGLANCPTPPCQGNHCPTYPLHLYMRVDGALTYDVSDGHDVNYVGMTADSTKVFFTSEEELTSDDLDASVDLYMWSEAGAKAGHPLTLVSKGDNPGNLGEPGQSNACKGGFTTPTETKSKNCDVVTFSTQSYCQLTGGEGGNCRTDSAIAADDGDIYFFSPEQLDGSLGIPDRENLYDFRNGTLQFVASFTGHDHCVESPVAGFTDTACTATPIARMQVSPDDSHAAFLTDNPITQYNPAGHLEMYLYDPAARRVICASCIPNGEPPSSDVRASQNGLFMTTDGRAFFTTEDPLAHADTNEGQDVYEYVDGRPQLITTGTGETRAQSGITSALLNPPGLYGVSADGRDVFFSTYDTLVSQDHNGLFLKYYDARAGGGFPIGNEEPPCEAADECHGAGSTPPAAMQGETGAALTGGNASQAKPKKNKGKKRHARHRRHAHRSGKASGGTR